MNDYRDIRKRNVVWRVMNLHASVCLHSSPFLKMEEESDLIGQVI